MLLENEQCPNCQKQIEPHRYQIHLLMCSSRQLRRSRLFANSNLQKSCMFCMEFINQTDLQQHMNNCQHRLVSCEDCRDMFPLSLFQEHREVCRFGLAAETGGQDTKQSSSLIGSIGLNVVGGLGLLGVKLFEKGWQIKQSVSDYYCQNVQPTIEGLRENYYKNQDKLLGLLEAAILPLAGQENVEGMPRYKIRQLETVLHRAGMEESCSICCVQYDEREPVKKLKCGHLYHPQCVMQWLQINRTCPMCRKDQMQN